MDILFKPLEINGGHVGVDESTAWTKPTRGSAGAAGWDLYAAEDVNLEAYQPCLVPTHLQIAIPEGHMLLVLPRSGNSLNKQIIVPNSPGLIDEDYRGHLQVILTWIPHPADTKKQELDPGEGYYTVDATLEIKRGDRIAQAVLVPYVAQNWCQLKAFDLPPTNRGTAGFGSTGT